MSIGSGNQFLEKSRLEAPGEEAGPSVWRRGEQRLQEAMRQAESLSTHTMEQWERHIRMVDPRIDVSDIDEAAQSAFLHVQQQLEEAKQKTEGRLQQFSKQYPKAQEKRQD